MLWKLMFLLVLGFDVASDNNHFGYLAVKF